MRTRSFLALAFLLAGACSTLDGGDDAGARPDAARVDASARVDAAGSRDAGALDSGAADAGRADASATDASATDAATDAGSDAGPLDPALCPIGEADGCCPLLRTGGSDPDCPSLDCDMLRAGDPILLEDVVGGSRSNELKGGTGVAWTGRELALVRTDWDMDGATRSIVVERRDATGALVLGPTRLTHRTSSGLRSRAGQAALAYEPASRTLAYADAQNQSWDVVGLTLDGSELFTTSADIACCNWDDGWVDVVAAGGRFLALGSSYTCAGSTEHPRLVEITLAGERTSFELGDGMRPRNSWKGHAACERDCASVGFFWDRSYEDDLRFRRVDPSDPSASTGATIGDGYFRSGLHETAAASDGERYLFVDWPGSLSVGSVSMRAGVYSPASGWEAPLAALPSPGAIPAVTRAIWTGDGYLVAAVMWSRMTGETSTPLSDPRRFFVRLYHFDRDGALRASWDNEDEANMFPQLAWAGGRIALTWTRIPAIGAGEPRRYLRFLDCP